MTDFCFEWPIFNRVLRQAAMMDRMMQRAGVEPGVAVRLDKGCAYYAARTRCIECPVADRCHAWLDDPQGGPLPPEYCPNVAFFQRCIESAEDRCATAA